MKEINNEIMMMSFVKIKEEFLKKTLLENTKIKEPITKGKIRYYVFLY